MNVAYGPDELKTFLEEASKVSLVCQNSESIMAFVNFVNRVFIFFAPYNHYMSRNSYIEIIADPII